ncbi:leucine Rich Repeat [Seminavis robusta]|uniref:Leucine Rich Repeat n=1 Tax=Seminavis robusta TaxID=568900 RepID=A0A9N8DWW6_9STRA|nr:leucine Rich Repeat [Seminavis robusta]|eukprot:Sro425_g140150.1 leucine Rich Repeat (637) ;mRNA; f:31150-33234
MNSSKVKDQATGDAPGQNEEEARQSAGIELLKDMLSPQSKADPKEGITIGNNGDIDQECSVMAIVPLPEPLPLATSPGMQTTPSLPGAYSVTSAFYIMAETDLEASPRPTNCETDSTTGPSPIDLDCMTTTNNAPTEEELAEATLIEQGMQVATPVEDKQKTKASPAKAYGVIFMVGLVVILAVSFGVVCASRSTNPVASHYRAWNIRKQLEESMGDGDYYFETSEHNEFQDVALHNRALDWLVVDDPLQLDADASNLLQRYLLALFYYQTSQNGPWLNCAPPIKGSQERTMCYFSRSGFPGESEAPAMRWLSGTSECQWAGVVCVDGVVEGLEFSKNNINGHIPTELAMLSQMKTLVLSHNALSGPIPNSTFLPAALERIYIDHNGLTGTIPGSLFHKLQKLTQLRLRSNRLSGSLPTEVGMYPGTLLLLSYNQLHGTLPTELFDLGRLEALVLDHNKISGTIPTLIGNLVNMKGLYLDSMQLSGTLPSEVGRMKSLTILELSQNQQLQGTIPETLFVGVPHLSVLMLDGCSFTGTISKQIGPHLEVLSLANNNFHGHIPTELSSVASDLSVLRVNGNNLTGTFPNEICVKMTKFSATVVADCTPDHAENNGVPAMACQCCTECCNRKTRICLKQ